MKVLVVEDEPVAGARLIGLLTRTGIPSDNVTYARSVAEARECLGVNVFDLAILDINLSDGSGLELAQLLKQVNRNLPVIFVTAYEEYALKAFDLGAAHYLLKPIRYEALVEALSRCGSAPVQTKGDALQLGIASGLWKVKASDIMAIVAEDKQAHVYTLDDDHHVKHSLSWLEEKVEGFIRLHRSCIVRLSAIDQVITTASGKRIKLRGLSREFPLSKRLAADVLARIQKDSP